MWVVGNQVLEPLLAASQDVQQLEAGSEAEESDLKPGTLWESGIQVVSLSLSKVSAVAATFLSCSASLKGPDLGFYCFIAVCLAFLLASSPTSIHCCLP